MRRAQAPLSPRGAIELVTGGKGDRHGKNQPMVYIVVPDTGGGGGGATDDGTANAKVAKLTGGGVPGDQLRWALALAAAAKVDPAPEFARAAAACR